MATFEGSVATLDDLASFPASSDAMDQLKRWNNAMTATMIMVFAIFVGTLITLFVERVHRLEVENAALQSQIDTLGKAILIPQPVRGTPKDGN